MTIKAGDTVIYHRDPKEVAADAARRTEGKAAAEKAESAYADVEKALAGVAAETRDKTLQPLKAELREARDRAQAWAEPTAKALVSFVHADGTVDVFVTGSPTLTQRTNVPVAPPPPSPARDYVTAE